MPPTQPLDPELAPTIEGLPPIQLDAAALPALRERQRLVAAAVPLSDAVVRADHSVDADVALAVRVHRPAGVDRPLPGVVSLHGGGLVVGTHLTDDALFDRWCPALGVVGVSVDYRLAPEHPYPAALDDAAAALAWTHANAAALGVDRACIGVRGVSAGGGIAAALALLARDRRGPAVAFQLLDAPMLDDRQQTPSSRQDGLPVWTREANAFGWRSYLGDLYGTEAVPPTAAAARADDLSGLPPAFVSVGSVDGFRDEAIDYAARLNQAGVPCELHVYQGAPHGYHLAGDTALLRRAREDMVRWLAHTIGRRS
jgi:acetyl esterase/lipase